MLPKQPKFEPGDPASPALSRRRNQLQPGAPEPEFGRDVALRAVREPQTSLLPDMDPPAEDEPEPDIPPSPGTGAPVQVAAAERVYGQGGRRRGFWLIGAAVVAVVSVGGLSWFLYHTLAGRTGASRDVPYVMADAGPEKVRPQQEGGVEAPNQDMGVYNELNGAKQPQKPEVLLPQPEAPMTPPPASATALGASQNQSTAVPTVPAPSLDAEPAAGSPAPAAPPAASASAQPAPDQTAVADTPTQTAMAAGAFRVQLAAVKSSDAAQVAWKKLTKTFPDVLKGLKLDVVKLERGADGALYRVQAGPFADRGAAEAACARLKGKNQGCLVVAP
jgi:hypothetical protein